MPWMRWNRRHPGLILKSAATRRRRPHPAPARGLDTFSAAFEAVARASLTAADLEKLIETDGELTPQECTLENAESDA